MNQVEIICIIIAAAGATFGVCGLIFQALKKKGIDSGEILKKVDSGLSLATQAVGEIKTLAPDTPYISTAEAIIEFADQGTKKAEQLYVSNQISADARKAEAISLTKDLLTAAGVTVTPQIETIIDGCVEAATYALPQTHTPENDARYAAHAAVAQPDPFEAPAKADDNPAGGVTIDQLNQAKATIDAAIAEKAAAQVPADADGKVTASADSTAQAGTQPENGAVVSGTMGAA